MDYLASRTDKLHPSDKLFDISEQQFSKSFTALNDQMGLGTLENGRRRFTSHMLRKFHATQLYSEKVSMEIVDALQGRGKDQTHSSYFYENPLKLKEIYVEHLNCLTINLDVNKLDIKSPEFIQLENENTELKKQNEKINELWNEINDMKIRQSTWEELKRS